MLVFSSSYVALSNCSGQLSIVKIIFCCFHELNEGADYGEIYSSHKEKLGRDQTLKKHFAPSVCISSNCKMYLSPIAKCICPNCKMYLSQLQKMYFKSWEKTKHWENKVNLLFAQDFWPEQVLQQRSSFRRDICDGVGILINFVGWLIKRIFISISSKSISTFKISIFIPIIYFAAIICTCKRF